MSPFQSPYKKRVRRIIRCGFLIESPSILSDCWRMLVCWAAPEAVERFRSGEMLGAFRPREQRGDS